MIEERRTFLKTTLAAGAVGVGTLLTAKYSLAEESKISSSSSGVITGTSPKKEILYTKTPAWDMYYKAAY
jgi:hypothetical protein